MCNRSSMLPFWKRLLMQRAEDEGAVDFWRGIGMVDCAFQRARVTSKAGGAWSAMSSVDLITSSPTQHRLNDCVNVTPG